MVGGKREKARIRPHGPTPDNLLVVHYMVELFEPEINPTTPRTPTPTPLDIMESPGLL